MVYFYILLIFSGIILVWFGTSMAHESWGEK